MSRTTFWLTVAVLVVAVLFGGANAQGWLGDTVAIVASIPLLAIAVHAHLAGRSPDRLALALSSAALMLPLLQILPWPGANPPFASVHAAWQIDHLRVFGIDLPTTLSLAPDATFRVLLSFVPPIALFLAVLALDAAERRMLKVAIVVLVVACAIWGVLQVAVGSRIDLVVHSDAPTQQAKGFFSNRNHFAALMYVGVALAGAGLVNAVRRMVGDIEMSRHGPRVIAWAMALLFALVGLMLSMSRAGVVLGAAILLALFVLTMVGLDRDVSRVRRWFVSLSALGVLVAVQMGLWGVLDRFKADPFEDARVYVQRTTLKAASEAQPWGTGLGTFRRVYEQREPLETVANTYVNRAHNDWLEFWLEAGWFGAALLMFAIGWWLWRLHGPPPFDEEESAGSRLLRRAAVVAVLAIAVHSLVDFPLRTLAMSSMLGVLLAISVPPRVPLRVPAEASEPRPQREGRRRRSERRTLGLP
jgi:O-antigen ligase